MADSAVAVTAGSGTSIDTRTEATNGNHRQVVVVGDPSVNAGVAPVDATAGLKVDLGADNDVAVSTVNGVAPAFGSGVRGSTVQRVTLATDDSIATVPGGSVAHDAADSGNPLKVGAKAESAVSTATMVADGDRTDLYADIDGVLIVRSDRPLGDLLSERLSNTDGASTASTVFGATASTRNVVTGYSVYNASATAGYLDFRDGTSGSILWTVPLPATGGANFAIPSGIFRTTANTALAIDVSAALTTVYVSITGFKSKV
jgi:hypothetical protein